ncbi:MAG TPA: ferrous iron transport protein B [Planctomycetota bacterium]
MTRATRAAETTLRVAIAGNPNTGKTTLFNQLTGARGKVGNYPGVTVERHFAPLALEGHGTVELMDVPGTYSLSARSREEQLAIQAVAGLHPLERPDLVVCVVDSTQAVRNLYLVLQLIELGLPLVVALNMSDRLESTGQTLDARALEEQLGVPCVPIVAARGQGLVELKRAMARVLSEPARGRPGWRWEPGDPLLVADARTVARELPAEWIAGDADRARALALWALLSLDEGDELAGIPPGLRAVVARRRKLAEASKRNLDEEIIRGRYEWLDARAKLFLRESAARISLTDRVDRVLLHPALGFAIFLALMTVVFQALFAGADPLIGWIEQLFAWLGARTAALLPAGLLADLVENGLVAGVGSVLVFLPQILLLFLFLGILEDTGYMARVAYLMDRVMRVLGLHGRAFVPMLSGYACAVPAILATRTMERQRDRLLTMLVVPLMTCSARLPVYGLLIAAMVPVGGAGPFTQGLLLAGMYLFSTVVALAAAAVLGRTVLKGPRVPLLLEMPPYRVPHWPSVVHMMWEKSLVFVKEAGTVILVCTVAMWALLSFPRHPGNEALELLGAQAEAVQEAIEGGDPEAVVDEAERRVAAERLAQSFGGRLGHALEPVLAPLGFDWKIGIGLIGAFAAREVFVSTMAVVYGLGAGEEENEVALRERLLTETRADGSRLYTPLVCLALMVFFALSCQCMSTLAVVKRETGSWRWPSFLFAYMTVLAWVASFAVYQGGKWLGFE